MNSFSRTETYNKCAYQYKLKYLDGLVPCPNLAPDNALYLGTALHCGIENRDAEKAVENYYSNYPIIEDKHVDEAIKLQYMVNLVLKGQLPENGDVEVKILCNDYIGFIDYLVPVGENLYDMYDFKYASNSARYKDSAQLSVYTYFFQKANPDKRIRNAYYVIAPKTNIRLKKTETLPQFRIRLRNELANKEIEFLNVPYSQEKVNQWLKDTEDMNTAVEFPKNPTRLCDWCDYKKYCESNEVNKEDIMTLPKNVKVSNDPNAKIRIWIYGQPFAGKTYLANQFPDVLMLNTDGNVKYVDAPRIRIRDEVTVEGRITKRTLAWDVFKDTIAELEKGSEFKTIVIDLVEDMYEHCRKWGYAQLGISHESDDSFRAWDYIRSEFLSVMKRFVNMDYNVILISHEDISRDIMKRTGDKVTSIRPNISDKVALKLAGMMDLVGRVIKNDDDSRVISFKTNDIVFGGGRIKISATEIPCSYDSLMTAIDNSLPDVKANSAEVEGESENAKQNESVETKTEPPTGETPESTVRRRRRKTREERENNVQ